MQLTIFLCVLKYNYFNYHNSHLFESRCNNCLSTYLKYAKFELNKYSIRLSQKCPTVPLQFHCPNFRNAKSGIGETNVQFLNIYKGWKSNAMFFQTSKVWGSIMPTKNFLGFYCVLITIFWEFPWGCPVYLYPRFLNCPPPHAFLVHSNGILF